LGAAERGIDEPRDVPAIIDATMQVTTIILKVFGLVVSEEKKVNYGFWGKRQHAFWEDL
jgi:hypothetical protein